MTRDLKARNKLGFADGTFPKEYVESIEVSKWERSNVVVCSWIFFSSISNSIYASYAYSKIAQDI